MPSAHHFKRLVIGRSRDDSNFAFFMKPAMFKETAAGPCPTLTEPSRPAAAPAKLMRKLLKKQGFAPDVPVTDKLRSYGAAKAALGAKKSQLFRSPEGGWKRLARIKVRRGLRLNGGRVLRRHVRPQYAAAQWPTIAPPRTPGTCSGTRLRAGFVHCGGQGVSPKSNVDCRMTFPACPTTRRKRAVSEEKRQAVPAEIIIDATLAQTGDFAASAGHGPSVGRDCSG